LASGGEAATLSLHPLAVCYPAAASLVKFFLSDAADGAQAVKSASEQTFGPLRDHSTALPESAVAHDWGTRLDIGILKHGEVTSVTLRGGLVLGPPTDNLRQTLDNLIAHGETQIVLGMTEVNRLDSSGIGILVKGLQLTKEAGGSLKLVNPAKVVLQTLSMCRLLPLFEVYDQEQQAIAAFR
jgi:anti-sigma B factor antagonist